MGLTLLLDQSMGEREESYSSHIYTVTDNLAFTTPIKMRFTVNLSYS